MKKLIDTSCLKVKEMLTQSQDRLRNLAKVLLEKETLEGEEIRKALGLPEKKKEALACDLTWSRSFYIVDGSKGFFE